MYVLSQYVIIPAAVKWLMLRGRNRASGAVRGIVPPAAGWPSPGLLCCVGGAAAVAAAHSILTIRPARGFASGICFQPGPAPSPRKPLACRSKSRRRQGSWWCASYARGGYPRWSGLGLVLAAARLPTVSRVQSAAAVKIALDQHRCLAVLSRRHIVANREFGTLQTGVGLT